MNNNTCSDKPFESDLKCFPVRDFWKEKIDELNEDVRKQLESKVKFCLQSNGFDFINYDRVLVKVYEHFDQLNEIWLDGILILKWSKFSFKQDGDKLIGSFEYMEV